MLLYYSFQSFITQNCIYHIKGHGPNRIDLNMTETNPITILTI